MHRRGFFGYLSYVTVILPHAAVAQRPAKVFRIGFLGPAPASAYAPRVNALRVGLQELGYIEGVNLIIEFKWAHKVEDLRALAADLVRMNVDLIFASSSTQVDAASRTTKTIPIVFANHADPIGSGHVASLAKPGGNVTGLSMLLTDLAPKELEILTMILPRGRRFGVVWSPLTPSNPPAVKALQAAAERLGLQLLVLPLRTADEIDSVFATLTTEQVDGALAVPSLLTYSERVRLAETAINRRLPVMFGLRENAEAGGLVSYGADTLDLHRRAAVYVHKILKGAEPADLPVEQASTYELVINLRTAKSLGIGIPPALLVNAHHVIE